VDLFYGSTLILDWCGVWTTGRLPESIRVTDYDLILVYFFRLNQNFSSTAKMEGVFRSFTINVCRRTVVTNHDVLYNLEYLKSLLNRIYYMISS